LFPQSCKFDSTHFKNPLLRNNLSFNVSCKLYLKKTVISLCSIEVSDRDFDFGSMDIYVFCSLIKFDFANISKKLIMNKYKQSLVETQSTLVFLLCDCHRNNILSYLYRNYFVICLYYFSHCYNLSINKTNKLSQSRINWFLACVKHNKTNQQLYHQ